MGTNGLSDGAALKARRIAGIRVWSMPIVAAATAALGSYLGVVRSIDHVRSELRVVQAEQHAAVAAIERRLAALESQLPRDAATQRDLMYQRETLSRAIESWIDRHEAVFHERRVP